jgi:hypothetical protein
MIHAIAQSIKPLMLNQQILNAAYDLYLQAPSAPDPVINLRELSHRTGASLLECRNTIVEAYHCGRFPRCALEA